MDETTPAGLGRYEIRIEGRLAARWAGWFDELALTEDRGGTLLAGPLADQAALHGVLQKIRDLGLPLISVTRTDTDRPVLGSRSTTPSREGNSS